jgi:hypothetical protein
MNPRLLQALRPSATRRSCLRFGEDPWFSVPGFRRVWLYRDSPLFTGEARHIAIPLWAVLPHTRRGGPNPHGKDGGELQRLTDFTDERLFWFEYSPDGETLVVSSGHYLRDAMLIRNFPLRRSDEPPSTGGWISLREALRHHAPHARPDL